MRGSMLLQPASSMSREICRAEPVFPGTQDPAKTTATAVATVPVAWHDPSTSQTTDRAAERSTNTLRHPCMVLDDATFEEVVNAQYESLYRFAYSLAQREE